MSEAEAEAVRQIPEHGEDYNRLRRAFAMGARWQATRPTQLTPHQVRAASRALDATTALAAVGVVIIEKEES